MQNDQSPPSMQASGYSFITNSSEKPKGSRDPSSMKGRIAVVGIGLVVLIILFVVISSFLGSAGKGQTEKYAALAKRQTEIIRLSTLAERKAKSLETRSYATTIRLSTTTGQQDMNSLLNKKGYGDKELSAILSSSKNAQSDTALDEAEKNNRFDETFTELIRTELTNYQKELNSASSGATKSEKQTLEAAFNQTKTLLK